MKKLLSVLLCVLVVAGCGTSPSQIPQSSEFPEIVPSSQGAASDPREWIGLPSMPITKEKYASMLDDELASRGLKKLSEYVMETEKSEKYKTTSYTYTFTDGFSLTLYEDDTNGQLYSLFFYSDTGNQNATVEGARAIGSVMAITMMGFEPDAVDRLEKELHIIDIKDGEKLRGAGNNCKFTHMRDGTIQMFSIYAAELQQTTDSQAEIPKYEAHLCFKGDPQTEFKRDKAIGIAERYNAEKGEELDLTYVWEYPDGSRYKTSQYLSASEKERVISLSQHCKVYGKGSVTITLTTTGEVLAELPFEIVK